MAIVLITHDLGVVAGLCERVMVMYAGRIVEQGPIDAFRRPTPSLHARAAAFDAAPRREEDCGADGDPRAAAEPSGIAGRLPVSRPLSVCLRALLLSDPNCSGSAWAGEGLPPGAAGVSAALLTVEDLGRPVRGPGRGLLRRRYLPLQAVDGVSFSLQPGETLGVVVDRLRQIHLGRAVLRLIEPSRGRVVWLGEDLGTPGPRRCAAIGARCRSCFRIHSPRLIRA